MTNDISNQGKIKGKKSIKHNVSHIKQAIKTRNQQQQKSKIQITINWTSQQRIFTSELAVSLKYTKSATKMRQPNPK